MEKKINVPKPVDQPLRVTLVKGDNWANTKSIDFGGAEVEFSGSFGGNSVITSITNGIVTNTSLAYFLEGCTSLEECSLDMSNVQNGYEAFMGCKLLKSFNGNLPSLTAGYYMFRGCSALTDVHIYAPNLTDGRQLFYGCHNITAISGNLDKLEMADDMFKDNWGTMKITKWDISLPKLKSGYRLFSECQTLSSFVSDLSSIEDTREMFRSCTSLKSFEIDMPNVLNSKEMFRSCTSLSSFTSDMRSVTAVNYMFSACSKLSNVVMIVNESNSAWTQSSFDVRTTAPCNAHRYCFNRNDGNVKLIFTADDYGSSDYQQIDCTDDDRTETITADTIIVLNDNGSYIADPPEGPAENPHKAIHINILLDDVFVTTTPSILSRGKFTWSKEEHEGWTQWQGKLWFKHEPLEPEPDWIDVTDDSGYSVQDGKAYNCVGRMFTFAIKVNPPEWRVPSTQVFHLIIKNSSPDSLDLMTPLVVKGVDSSGQSFRINYGDVWEGDVTLSDDGYGYTKITDYTKTN